MSLFHIPPELMTRILLYISPHDIISCARTCRTLYDMCSVPLLRYLVQMERCAVSDDMRPGLGYLDRLQILEKREEAWAMLDFRRSVQVSVPFKSTGLYEFTGGAFLLGTTLNDVSHGPMVGYSYITLPSFSDIQDQKLEWNGLNLETQILDVGLAVHEHNLIAALTACVFPTVLLLHDIDFREAKRTWTIHRTGVRPWRYGYSAFQLAGLIPLQSNPLSLSPRKVCFLVATVSRLKPLGISSHF